MQVSVQGLLAQCGAVETNAGPTIEDEGADIGVILASRVAEYVVPVVATEEGEGFGFAQGLELAEVEDLAGTLVFSRLIDQVAVGEAGGLVVVVLVDELHYLLEFHGLRLAPK